jgi:hypothetical protein
MEKVASTALGPPVGHSRVATGNLFSRRSRGIRTYGSALSIQDWGGLDRTTCHDTTSPQPLPDGVDHHGVVATLAAVGGLSAHTLGDGLVRPASASYTPGGEHRTLIHIPAAGHNRLLDHPDVAALLHDVAVAGASRA